MRTTQIKVYLFEELKKDIQEKVLDDNREINTEFYDWYEYLFEDFKEELNKIGLSSDGFSFDLYRNEISFNKPNINNQDVFINSVLSHKDKILNQLEKDNNKEDEEELSLNLDENGNIDLFSYDENIKEEEIEEIENKLTESTRDLLKTFLKRLEKEYEYFISDESIKDTLISNEYEFEENGKRF